MRIAKIGYIVMASVLCGLGIMLIAVPEFSISVLRIICGVTLIVFGVIRLVGYLSKDLYRLAFQYDLVFGAIMLVIGIMLLANPKNLMTVICVASGISIFAEAICKINISVEARKFGIHLWWLIMAFAILSGIFGLILIFRPGESSNLLAVLLGISLLSEGILNLITVITAVKIIKHQRPDVIEAEYYDKSED